MLKVPILPAEPPSEDDDFYFRACKGMTIIGIGQNFLVGR